MRAAARPADHVEALEAERARRRGDVRDAVGDHTSGERRRRSVARAGVRHEAQAAPGRRGHERGVRQTRHRRADVEQQRVRAGAVACPALEATPVAERQREAVAAHTLILDPTSATILRRCRATASPSRSPPAKPTRSARATSRRLRKEGLIPGVLYGRGHTRAILVKERDLRTALTGRSGLHAILDVVIEGQKTPHHAVLKQYQQHPIRGTLTHVDFHEVRLDQPIQASVSVQLVGESPGAKEGGVVQQVTRELRLEALPTGDSGAHRGGHLAARGRWHAPARGAARDRGRHVPRRPGDRARDLRHLARRDRARGGRRRGRRGGRGRGRRRGRAAGEAEEAAEASGEDEQADGE